MDWSKEDEQRKDFRKVLFDLATKQELLQDARTRSEMYKRLEAIYYTEETESSFRHFYSDIFSVLTQIQLNPSLGDINILGQNLAMIRKGYNPQNLDKNGALIDISDNIRKLYDHVNLDIARILYSEGEARKLSGMKISAEIESQTKQIDELKTVVQNTRREIDSTRKELRNCHKIN